MSKPGQFNRAVASAAIATAFTVVAGVAHYSLIHNTVARWVAFAAFTPALPAWFVLLLIPVGRRVDGIPIPPPFALLVVTFAVWWAALYAILGRYRRQSD